MRRRPISVTIFAIFVLFLTAWNAIRLYAAISSWSLLADLGARPGPFYIAVTALVWVIAGLTVYFGAWQGRDWSRKAGWLFIIGYIVYFWADRLLFRPLEWSQDLLLVIALQLVALGIAASALSSEAGRSFFRQRQKNDGST